MVLSGIIKIFLLLCLMMPVTEGLIRAGEKTDDLAKVSIHSTLKELNDYRPGYLYLVVENLSDTLLFVDRIEIAEYPDFIDVKKSSLDSCALSRKRPVLFYPDKKTINAGESGVYELFIEASGQLKPGNHLLLFNVFFNGWVLDKSLRDTSKVHVPRKGSLTEGHEFEVKVFGEGEILGALSNAVTFLMIPGFIMLIMFSMVWKMSAHVSYQEKLPGWLRETKIVDLQFLVIGITLSLLMAKFLYPFLTQVFTSVRRDYLYGYRFSDIVMMWGFSVLLGGLVGLSAGWLISLYRKIKYRKAIHGDEDILLFLKKAVDLGVKEARLKKVSINASGKFGYILEKDDVDKDPFWVIPRISVEWKASADKFYETFQAERDKNTNLSDMLKILEEGHNGGYLQKIEWEKNLQYITSPLQVKKADVGDSSELENIFSTQQG